MGPTFCGPPFRCACLRAATTPVIIYDQMPAHVSLCMHSDMPGNLITSAGWLIDCQMALAAVYGLPRRSPCLHARMASMSMTIDGTSAPTMTMTLRPTCQHIGTAPGLGFSAGSSKPLYDARSPQALLPGTVLPGFAGLQLVLCHPALPPSVAQDTC